MVYRYEGSSSWNFMDSVSFSDHCYSFGNILPFVSDTVYIAYWIPYPASQLNEYLDGIEPGKNHIEKGFASSTEQGSRLPYIKIQGIGMEKASQVKVVVIARQHADESPSSYALEGFVDAVMQTGYPESEINVEYLIIPMANRGEVTAGSTVAGKKDMNSMWFLTSDSREMSGENRIISDLINTHFGGTADFFIDLHAQAGGTGKYYFWGIKSSEIAEHNEISAGLASRISVIFEKEHHEISLISPVISRDIYSFPGPWADYWAMETLGAIPFTFEITSVPPVKNADIYRAAGKSIAEGLKEIIPGYLEGKCNEMQKMALKNNQTEDPVYLPDGSGKTGSTRQPGQSLIHRTE